MSLNILVINPGSTSDRVSYYRGEDDAFHKTVGYSPVDLAPYESKLATAQSEMRREFVLKTLREENVELREIDAVVGRGGLLKPVEGGTYIVNEAMLKDLRAGVSGDHPASLGGIIAWGIANPLGKPAYIADPPVVDEMEPLARYSGMVDNPRISLFHALNHKQVGRLAAKELGKPYQECNLIIMHGGGGISVGAHCKGRVVDVNNALDGEGPFTPQRSGSVPVGRLAVMCFSREYSNLQIKLMIKGHGGLVAHTGTSDLKLLERFITGEDISEEERKMLLPDLTPGKALEAIEAMCYQIGKEICGLTAVFPGPPDAIVLTGGITYNERILKLLRDRLEWLATILVFPGGDEMFALKEAARRVLIGEEEARIYV